MVTILRERCAADAGGGQKARRQCPDDLGWRKHFGRLEPADVKRLRHLEQENNRLKRLVAERDLDIEVLKEITRKKW